MLDAAQCRGATGAGRPLLSRLIATWICTCVGLGVWLGCASQVNAAIDEATLYTIGPGSAFSERYGHSVICLRDSTLAPAEGTCVDFGVPESVGSWRFAWSMLRGQARFVPTAVPEKVVVGAFQAQGRKIESQRLPLDPTELERLSSELERSAAAATPYAYHPYWANCSTELRDRIDRATSSRLQRSTAEHGPEVQSEANAPTLRELSERGNSGRLPELTLFALGLGAATDRVPSTWESLFLPTALRDEVTALGSAPTLVAEQVAIALPTSTHVGRGVLLALGVVLAAAVHWGRRRFSDRTLIRIAGLTLGAVGLLCWLVAAVSAWDEVRWNWALLLVVPSDLMLGWMNAKSRQNYLSVRLAGLSLLTALSLVGLIAQPLWAVMLLPGLPLGVLYWQTLRPAPATTPQTGATSPVAG